MTKFLASVEDPTQRSDARKLVRMLRDATGAKPTMWGDKLVGFGRYDYANASGAPASWFRIGLSPRKRDLTVYIMPGFARSKDAPEEAGPAQDGKVVPVHQALGRCGR